MPRTSRGRLLRSGAGAWSFIRPQKKEIERGKWYGLKCPGWWKCSLAAIRNQPNDHPQPTCTGIMTDYALLYFQHTPPQQPNSKLCLARNGPQARYTGYRKTLHPQCHFVSRPYFCSRVIHTITHHQYKLRTRPNDQNTQLARNTALCLGFTVSATRPSPNGTDDRVERGGHATVPSTGCRAPSAPLP